MKTAWGLLIRKRERGWWELAGCHWEPPLFPAPIHSLPPSKPQEVGWGLSSNQPYTAAPVGPAHTFSDAGGRGGE